MCLLGRFRANLSDAGEAVNAAFPSRPGGSLAGQPMGVLFEHRLRIAGFETRALELDGDGPAAAAASHGWSPTAPTPGARRSTGCGGAGGARSPSTCPGYGTATPHSSHEQPILSQLDRFLTRPR